MNSNLTIFGMLLGATLFFNVTMNYMGDNITEFENRPLPPKKIQKIETLNPVLKVDATSRETWTLIDFSTGQAHRVPDPENQPRQLAGLSWDLGFQRTKIITNGGVTHPAGGVGVLDLGPVDIDSVLRVPSSGFVEDTRDWGNIRNGALADWYIYRTRTHNVESKKSVYVVRAHDSGHVKLRILNYYCDHSEAECRTQMCTREEAACLTIEYVYLPPGQNRFPTAALAAAPKPEPVTAP